MRRVTEDPAEFGDLVAQCGGTAAAAATRRTPVRVGRGSRARRPRMLGHVLRAPSTIAQSSPGRHRTDSVLACPTDQIVRPRGAASAAVSCASSPRAGPRSVEAASKSANGPPIRASGNGVIRRSDTSTRTPAAIKTRSQCTGVMCPPRAITVDGRQIISRNDLAVSREPSRRGARAPGTAATSVVARRGGRCGFQPLTGGVNRLPPVGLIHFSVEGHRRGGRRAGVVVDVSGANFSPPPQAAVRPIIATIAVPPTAAAIRRARRFDFMLQS